MLIAGGCHCGNIRFVLAWEPDPVEIVARACTCGFCTKHGNIWTSKPDAQLDIAIRDPSFSASYEFGTKTAQFHICTKCGVTPAVTCLIDGKLYAVVNVNTFDASFPIPVRRVPATLDDESTADRLDRRRRNWIGHVSLEQANS
jgi:hypothetical protein